MGVVEGGPENLPARNILEGRGNPAAHLHRAGIDRLGRAEARQRGAERAHQEDRLDHVAARLLDGERRQFAVVQRALGHDAVDAERKLLGDLGQRHLGNVTVAAPLMRQQAMGVLDGAFASLDGNVHAQPPLAASRVVRGIATIASSWTSTTSMPRGNSVTLMASRSNRSCGWIEACSDRRAVDAGAAQLERGALRQAFDLQDQRRRTIRIFIAAEREAIERRKVLGIADQRKTADRGIRNDRRAGVEFEPFGDIRLSPTSGRRARPAYRGRTGSARWRRCRASSRQACRRRPRYAECCRDAPSHPSRSGRSIAPTTPCRQIRRAVRQRVVMSALTPYQRVEIDPRRRGLRGLAVPLCDHRRTQRRDHLCFHAPANLSDCTMASHSAIIRAFCTVAAERVAEADFAGRKPHRRARHRGFAEVEGAPSPPMRPRTMTRPFSGSRRFSCAGSAIASRRPAYLGRLRNAPAPPSPPCAGLACCLFLACHHIGLAGIKLSMILDNLITKRHDVS